MHKSIFSYNLSRLYPYAWFTYLVFTGDILATAFIDLPLVPSSNSDNIEKGNDFTKQMCGLRTCVAPSGLFGPMLYDRRIFMFINRISLNRFSALCSQNSAP
jgi:hypothetical protein